MSGRRWEDHISGPLGGPIFSPRPASELQPSKPPNSIQSISHPPSFTPPQDTIYPNPLVSTSDIPSTSLPSYIEPSPPTTTNSHPMMTKSKHGIFKPKAFVTKAPHLDYILTQPQTYCVATQ